jgi:hypothetical protein
MPRFATGPGLLLALWSPLALGQLPQASPSTQILIYDSGRVIEMRPREMLPDATSQIYDLETIYRNDPVDLPWAEATELRLRESLNSLGFDFRQIEVSCKTQICKIVSEISYGSFVGEDMTRRYFDNFREIAQRGIGTVSRPEGPPLTIINGERGPVMTHYLYSTALVPAVVPILAR